MDANSPALQDGEGPSRKNSTKKLKFRGTRSSTRKELSEEGANNDGMPFTLTHPEVLDCPICYEPLTPPVFQCEHGHVACSSCCTKVKNKCASCGSSTSYRSRAVENILDSVMVKCQYAIYGCKVTMSYHKKHDHKKTCIHSPCSCPLPNCNFLGSSSQLYRHYSRQHKNSAVEFQYNRLVHITLNVDDKFLVLQEEEDGLLFVLHSRTEPLGSIIVIYCIATELKTCYYDISARLGNSTTTLKFHSSSLCFKERLNDPLSVFRFDTSGFLIVPSNFVGSNRQLELDICIWKPGTSPDELDISLNRAVNIG